MTACTAHQRSDRVLAASSVSMNCGPGPAARSRLAIAGRPPPLRPSAAHAAVPRAQQWAGLTSPTQSHRPATPPTSAAGSAPARWPPPRASPVRPASCRGGQPRSCVCRPTRAPSPPAAPALCFYGGRAGASLGQGCRPWRRLLRQRSFGDPPLLLRCARGALRIQELLVQKQAPACHSVSSLHPCLGFQHQQIKFARLTSEETRFLAGVHTTSS